MALEARSIHRSTKDLGGLLAHPHALDNVSSRWRSWDAATHRSNDLTSMGIPPRFEAAN